MAKPKKLDGALTRDAVVAAISGLPDGATFEDGLYTLGTLAKIQRGLEQVAAGQTVPHSEVRARLKERIKQLESGRTLAFPPPNEQKPAEIAMPKDEVMGNLIALPENVSIDEAIDRLSFLSRVARARAEITAGQTFTQEEVRARVIPWLP